MGQSLGQLVQDFSKGVVWFIKTTQTTLVMPNVHFMQLRNDYQIYTETITSHT